MATFLHNQLPLFPLISLFLPLFCLLFSWASPTTTPPPPPPTSVSAAATTLHNRGYSLFAATLNAAANTPSWNGTGTILAPPDFAFSFATAKFNNYHRAPPRPSTSLLLYHTLRLPLRWDHLSTHQNGHEFPTFHHNRCVFISKNIAGEISVAGSKKPIGGAYVTIRQPNLYVAHDLTVHGVDGVLDLSSASRCLFPDDSNAEINSSSAVVDRSYIDHAVRALRRLGYGAVATSMAIRLSELMNFPAITVFAPTDENLFSPSDGFRYDFRRHVIPRRLHLQDLETIYLGKKIETLAPGKPVVVASSNGAVTVNGVPIKPSEIYQNRWVVVFDVPLTLDDANESSTKRQFAGEAYSWSSDSDLFKGVRPPSPSPSPALIHSGERENSVGRLSPMSFSEYGEEALSRASGGSPSPPPAVSVLTETRCRPAASPVHSNGVVSTLSLGLQEDEDLYCPVSTERSTPPSEIPSIVDVAEYAPSIAYGETSVMVDESVPSEKAPGKLERRTLSSYVSSSDEPDHPSIDDVSYYV